MCVQGLGFLTCVLSPLVPKYGPTPALAETFHICLCASCFVRLKVFTFRTSLDSLRQGPVWAVVKQSSSNDLPPPPLLFPRSECDSEGSHRSGSGASFLLQVIHNPQVVLAAGASVPGVRLLEFGRSTTHVIHASVPTDTCVRSSAGCSSEISRNFSVDLASKTSTGNLVLSW